MVDYPALLHALNEFAAALPGNFDTSSVLYDMAHATVPVAGVDAAGVSLGFEDGVLSFVAATSEDAAELEELQITAGEGPCRQAHNTSEPVLVPDLRSEDRWPEYVQKALGLGFRAVVGMPMIAQNRSIGAVNVYSREPREWDAEAVDALRVLTAVATSYVMAATAITQSRALSDQLQQALDSRIVIEQAKGIVAARARLSVNDAFQVIRRRARDSNRRLHDVCAEIVASHPGEGKLG